MKVRIVFVSLTLLCTLLLVSTNRAEEDQQHNPILVYSSEGVLQANTHVVVGHLGSGQSGTVTLRGAAAFTGKDSYRCFTSMQVGGIATNYKTVDGSHFSFPALSSGREAEVDYICIGN